ncbi:MAG: hypothetical protein Q8O61_18315, partial [Nocardioides sp.]|nr:hypothetical protein [Nocardioides sp.]
MPRRAGDARLAGVPRGPGVRYLDVKELSVHSPPFQESQDMAKIIYTHTDEAPLLATYSFLPI